MKKFLIAVVLMILSVSAFALSSQVVSFYDQTGMINITGTACNISGFQLVSWPAHATITAYDAVSSTVVDGTSNTLFVISDQAIANIVAAKLWPVTLSLNMPVVFDSAANFFITAKPFAAYKKATKGIVLNVDAATNSLSANFYLTVE